MQLVLQSDWLLASQLVPLQGWQPVRRPAKQQAMPLEQQPDWQMGMREAPLRDWPLEQLRAQQLVPPQG